MNTSRRHKGLERDHSELSTDNSNDGSSARTRPFSYEDIMLIRRNKKVVVGIQDTHVEGDEGEQIFEKASYDSESERDRRDNPGSIISKDVSLDSRRESSRRKDENTSSLRKSKLVKDKTEQSRDGTKTMSNSDMKYHTRGGKSDRYIESGEGRSSNRSKDRSDERHLRDLGRNNASPSKSAKKYQKDRYREEHTNYDDRGGKKKRNVDQTLHNDEGELNKRHSRDWISTDGHRDSDRRQLDKASKKRHEDDLQLKERDREVKKPQLRSSIVSNSSEKNSERSRKDTLQRHREEPSQKRKRSRSRGPDDERKQPSLSSRGHRRSSISNQEGKVSPSRSSKDKSEKAHPELERKRGSTNGTNGNYRRYSGHSSGLGGYSPRKRKTEVAPRTPSSTHHSPEKRDAGWELKPLGKDVNVTVPVASDISSSQIVSATQNKSLDVTPKVAIPIGPTISSPYISSSHVNAIDAIQLTQATRPKRRLYVENLPFSTSEKALMEWINNFLLSSGVNYIHGTLPCISCMIHQDRGQALLEFLTPEDASAALSFDGRAFSGSILKIRRPKDFIEVTTGGDKSTEVAYSISDAVENSSNKIFIGGISKLISSEMLMEIAKTFGPLKAFHFEHSTEIDAQVAFLEYEDHLVTLKACAGLNGMKLGGQVLTVVQAFPYNLQQRNDSHLPLYGIPENAKPLMEKPTEVLKLKNVLDPEQLSSLSLVEVEEILEDIRLECTRFGAVKAVNVVKSSYSSITATCAATDGTLPLNPKAVCQEVMLETRPDELGGFDTSNTPRNTTEPAQDNIILDDKPGTDNTLSSSIQLDESDKTEVGNGISSDKLPVDLVKDEIDESLLQDEVSEGMNAGCDEKRSLLSPHASQNPLLEKDEVSVASPIKAPEAPNEENIEDSRSEEESAKLPSDCKLINGEKNELEVSERVENSEITNFCSVLEAGCILVEFKRAEASCTAAHCLHGRLFSDRIVSVEYVPVNLYRKSFPK